MAENERELLRRLNAVIHHDMGLAELSAGPVQERRMHRIIPILLGGDLLGSVVYFEPIDDNGLESLLVEQVDMLQTYVMDYLGRACPECPLHEHPVSVNLVEGVACWRCPSTSTTWRLGELEVND